MPFSRSRSPESIARSSTCWCSPNAPACQSILSTRVVFPWSTWATMATLRMSPRVFMGMSTIVSGIRARSGPPRARGDQPRRRRQREAAVRRIRVAMRSTMGRSAGQPGHVVQVVRREPAQLVVVLQRRRLARRDHRPPDGHGVGLPQRPASVLPADREAPRRARTDTPSSSRSSRCSACSPVSPGSTLPPGELPPAGERRRLGPTGAQQARGVLEVVDDRSADHRPHLENACRRGIVGHLSPFAWIVWLHPESPPRPFAH